MLMNYEFNTHQFTNSPIRQLTQFADLFPPSTEYCFPVVVNEDTFVPKNC